jgi:hypothetical protein
LVSVGVWRTSRSTGTFRWPCALLPRESRIYAVIMIRHGSPLR